MGRSAVLMAGVDDIPPASLAIARGRQVNKTDWKNNKYAERTFG